MLTPFFSPKGVAVIGASRESHKLGYGVVRNLVEHKFPGEVYPVHPAAAEILGRKCYPTIADVPDPVDLAIIIVAAPKVPAAVAACGQRGIKHVIVPSGGFREAGEKGAALEAELAATAEKYDVKVMGPNCIGSIDTHTPLNTTFVVGMPRAGDIGFVSQSGAMCAVVIDWAQGKGIGFSRIVSLGNQVGVTETETLAALGNDPNTRVITLYMEGVSNGEAFIRTAAKVARRKPIIAIKGGRGKGGAQAVASHTGSLAGSTEAYDAAFARAGVLRADSMQEMFNWARALAWQPLPKGNRVAVLTHAGGPGIMAVDAIEAAGLTLAPLTAETKSTLKKQLPPAASVHNPVDILAGPGVGTYALALEALLTDPTVDAVLVIMAPNDWFLPTSLADTVADIAARHRKPVLTAIMGEISTAADDARAILSRRRIPNFTFPEEAPSALAAMWHRKQWLDAVESTPFTLQQVDRAAAQTALDAGDFTDALAAYGIALPPSEFAATPADAIRLAETMGYPVALKLVSADITHKSDVGGVVLNLSDGEAVARAFGQIMDAARAANASAKLDGVLVQKMLTGGQELIIGARRDPQFGALVLVGTGGVEVELVRDVATAIAPLSPAQAERLLDETIAGKRLHGWRNISPADRTAVIDALVRLSHLAADFPQIAEVEINPFYALPMGGFAVDVRGVVRQA